MYSKIPQEIIELKEPLKFKKALKKFHKNPKDLPKIKNQQMITKLQITK